MDDIMPTSPETASPPLGPSQLVLPDLVYPTAKNDSTAAPKTNALQNDISRTPLVKKPKAPRSKKKRPEGEAKENAQADNAALNLDCLFARSLLSHSERNSNIDLISDILPGISETAGGGVQRAVITAIMPALAACASHAVAYSDPDTAIERPLSLRAAVIGSKAVMAEVVAPTMQALYCTENDEIDAWEAMSATRLASRALQTARAKFAAQAAVAAGILGAPLDVTIPPITENPAPGRRVIRNPTRARDLALALGRAGLVIIDDHIMPTITSSGRNQLANAATLLAAASSGATVELEDRKGRRTLRTSPVSVIGRLDRADLFWLHRLEEIELAATIFVDAGDASPVSGKVLDGLTSLLRKVRELTPIEPGRPRVLRLSSGAKKMLDGLHYKADLRPLSLYVDAIRDLACRLATLMQIAMWAEGTGQLASDVSAEAARRALELIRAVVWPEAYRALSTASVPAEVHSARRVLSHIQHVTSPADPVFVRRSLVIQWARSMTISNLDDAIAVLCGAGLLTPQEKVAGIFTVNPIVYAPSNSLPDLRVDPRKRGA